MSATEVDILRKKEASKKRGRHQWAGDWPQTPPLPGPGIVSRMSRSPTYLQLGPDPPYPVSSTYPRPETGPSGPDPLIRTAPSQ
mgnify:CR=1 FL=1